MPGVKDPQIEGKKLLDEMREQGVPSPSRSEITVPGGKARANSVVVRAVAGRPKGRSPGRAHVHSPGPTEPLGRCGCSTPAGGAEKGVFLRPRRYFHEAERLGVVLGGGGGGGQHLPSANHDDPRCARPIPPAARSSRELQQTEPEGARAPGNPDPVRGTGAGGGGDELGRREDSREAEAWTAGRGSA